MVVRICHCPERGGSFKRKDQPLFISEINGTRKDYGRLAVIIFDLRKKGYDILTMMEYK